MQQDRMSAGKQQKLQLVTAATACHHTGVCAIGVAGNLSGLLSGVNFANGYVDNLILKVPMLPDKHFKNKQWNH